MQWLLRNLPRQSYQASREIGDDEDEVQGKTQEKESRQVEISRDNAKLVAKTVSAE